MVYLLFFRPYLYLFRIFHLSGIHRQVLRVQECHKRYLWNFLCFSENMDIDELIEFLKMKGKFMSTDEGFTVDITKVCNH